ncbi:MAG: hypothetical protein NTV45_04110 [Firmicutes bacterium]|nr:hypothetical protein [Bacillota bacterium]
MNILLYLCCRFPPEKVFSQGELDYYAGNSEWIESTSKKEAVNEYRKRHFWQTKWYANNDIKILSESARLLNITKDGENGYMIAMKKLIESYLD